jgi:NADH-quinone oxidoreductase subunit L
MAGPTPVSALIHAATMVTAGVYLVARLSFLFVLSPTAMAVVAAVGAFTALFAALAALAQNDLKKLLAYSTVSQLGFMVLGVGLGAFWQATFHLVTHAFFKACLFLGAGSVILACRHEQDLRRLGGLRQRMGQTSKTFLVAALALAGVPPLSGFFSKDAILHFVHASAPAGLAGLAQAVYWIATLAALFTALYAFRLYFLVFEGEPRSEAAAQARESGAAITAPLWILAGLALFASVWGWPWRPFAMLTRSGLREPLFQNFTHPVFAAADGDLGVASAAAGQGLLAQMGLAAAVALAGVGLAFWLWRRGGEARLAPLLATRPGRLAARGAQNAFGTETLVRWAVVLPFAALAALAHEVIERFAIDGLLVGGARRLAGGASRALRIVQNGDLQRYAAVMAIAAVLAVAIAIGFWTQLFTLGGS